MKAEKFFTNRWGILLSVVGATFLWGSAFPIIKLSYAALEINSNEIGEQLLFAGYRFFLAALFIIFFLLMMKKRTFVKRENFGTIAKISFFQTFLQYILFYIGLSLSTGIQGSIIAGTTSFFQIVLAHFMYNDDYISWKKIVGLLIGFTGVIFVNLTKGSFQLDIGLGEILLLLAMAISAFGNILAKNGTTKVDVGNLTAFQMLLGSFGLLIIGFVSSGFLPFHFDLKSFFMLIYLALLSAVGFILWNNVMKYNKVGKVSIFLFLIPVFGVLLSNILLQEPIHLFVLVGLAFVASGIVIVNRKDATN
jgi:drug/metabolite transporter (DMT)-like permease